MTVHFCGLARDCEDTISRNLDSIIRIGEDERIDEYRIWVAENDSDDRTKDILKEYDETNENIKFYDYEGLDEEIENRVKRIMYLREEILNKLKKYVGDKKEDIIYCPIDLDSEIASSVDLDVFISECERVENGELNAIFPASEPYYYDIYALRKEGWVEGNCWGKVNIRTRTLSFWQKRKHIFDKQIHISDIFENKNIQVESAFGGFGIYNMSSAISSSYARQDKRLDEDGITCEHVYFNSNIDKKEISTELIVKAPEEHIKYTKKSKIEKIFHIISLPIADIKKVLYKTLRTLNTKLK